MAGTLDEMAHGIVMVLRATTEPEPLNVQLRGHTHGQALYLAQAVADGCSASAIPLARIEIGRWECFEAGGEHPPRFEGGGVALVVSPEVGSELAFYRYSG